MNARVRSLIALNAIGGIAVLTSYALGLFSDSSVGAELWGGVPEGLRPLYTVNMFLAAAGYFLFTPYILFKLDPEKTRIAGRFGYGMFHVLYALVLFPSAIWLQLTEAMIAQPSAWMWAAVRVDLALVGLGSLGLLVSLLTLNAPVTRGRALAVLGLLPFCLQTAVLDATVWPIFFPFANQ
ncbi:MAG: hypothetical protein JRF15_06260 [Deltaproteobacteria bacterium]|nr:hypothetical protein [Deltaproteobacteria bacterium]